MGFSKEVGWSSSPSWGPEETSTDPPLLSSLESFDEEEVSGFEELDELGALELLEEEETLPTGAEEEGRQLEELEAGRSTTAEEEDGFWSWELPVWEPWP